LRIFFPRFLLESEHLFFSEPGSHQEGGGGVGLLPRGPSPGGGIGAIEEEVVVVDGRGAGSSRSKFNKERGGNRNPGERGGVGGVGEVNVVLRAGGGVGVDDGVGVGVEGGVGVGVVDPVGGAPEGRGISLTTKGIGVVVVGGGGSPGGRIPTGARTGRAGEEEGVMTGGSPLGNGMEAELPSGIGGNGDS